VRQKRLGIGKGDSIYNGKLLIHAVTYLEPRLVLGLAKTEIDGQAKEIENSRRLLTLILLLYLTIFKAQLTMSGINLEKFGRCIP